MGKGNGNGSAVFAGVSDQELRDRLERLQIEKRQLRAEQGGGIFRDLALAAFEQFSDAMQALAAETLSGVALAGNARPLGGGGSLIAGPVREAVLLDHLVHGGFLERLQTEIESGEGFSQVTSLKMAELTASQEQEVREIRTELGRRYDERRAARERLRALEAIEAGETTAAL